MNSVNEIIAECYSLINLCSNIERIDLFYAVKEVKACIKEMQAEYEKDRYSDELLELLKMQTNRAAIYLEYLVTVFSSQARQRYMDRVLVAKLFISVRHVMKEEAATGYRNRAFIGTMCCNYAHCDSLLRRSQNIGFKLSVEDKELIETIQRQITVYTKYV